MNKIKCIEVRKIKNHSLLATVAYNNFIYLTKFPELMHTKEDIVKALQSDGNLCYLLYDGNNLIGYLIGDFRTLQDSRYAYYISYLYISKQYRDKKLGSRLMDKIIKKCQDTGVKFIVLTCDTKDDKIIRFYERYGFKVDSYLGGGKRHEVFTLYI